MWLNQKAPSSELSTVLITNGNLLSMLSLGDWLAKHGHHLKAVVITTKLPSTKSNVSGLWQMFWRSGWLYTYFKLFTNRFLPSRFTLLGLPTTIPQLLRIYRLSADVIYADDVNEPSVIGQIRSYAPKILLSFSATTRFCDELINVPSRVAINTHYALLPGYAGLSPYYWYVHHREPEAGITMHVIHSKLDAGPIICQERFNTSGIRSVMGLLNRQMDMVSPVLNRYYDGELHENNAIPQDLSQRSYFRHPTREQVSEFRNKSLVFWTRDDVNQMCRTATALREKAPQVIRSGLERRPVSADDPCVTPEAMDIANSWYVPRIAPPPERTWLVYSLDFVLATLQGCIAEPEHVNRSPGWVLAGTIVRAMMGVLQLLIMILAWTPIVNWGVEILARTFTRNAFGFFLRSCYWKARLKKLGTDTIIDQNVEIWGPASVSIGSNCHIDTNVRLAAGERRHRQHGNISIGNYVHLGPGVHIAGRGTVVIKDYVGISANAHLYSATNAIEYPSDPGQLISMSHRAPAGMQHVIEGPIVVGEFAFIGMMARIMPNTRIGYGAVIHAATELARDVPPFANISSVPRGRQIGWRKPRRPSPRLDGNGNPSARPSGAAAVRPTEPRRIEADARDTAGKAD